MSQAETPTLARLVTVCEDCGIVDGVVLDRGQIGETVAPELMPSYYHYERCSADLVGDIHYDVAGNDLQQALEEGNEAALVVPRDLDWTPPGVAQ